MIHLDTQTAQASLSAWRELEEADNPESIIDSSEASLENLPTSAGVSLLALKRLGFDMESRHLNAEKLYGRPLSRVWRFVVACEMEKPELRQTRLTEFARSVEPIVEAA